MSIDATPAHGIPRPTPQQLIEHDEYSTISIELRQQIRAAFTTALANARTWEPGRTTHGDCLTAGPVP